MDSSTVKIRNKSKHKSNIEKFSKRWFFAAINGKTQTIKKIISRLQADEIEDFLHTTNKMGQSALMVAAKNGRTQVVQVLLDSVDNFDNEDTNQELAVNETDNHRRTALMLAAQFGHVITAETLLSAVDGDELLDLLNLKNDLGEDAIAIAKKYNQDEMVIFLTVTKAELENNSEEENLEEEPYLLSMPFSPVPLLSPLSAFPAVKFDLPPVSPKPVVFRNSSAEVTPINAPTNTSMTEQPQVAIRHYLKPAGIK